MPELTERIVIGVQPHPSQEERVTFYSPQLVEDVAKFLHNCNDDKWAEGADKPCPGGTVWTIKCSDEYKQEQRSRARKLIALVRSSD